MKLKSVIVIGAGIGGITAATHLARSGFHVTVLEKNAHPGGRCYEIVAGAVGKHPAGELPGASTLLAGRRPALPDCSGQIGQPEFPKSLRFLQLSESNSWWGPAPIPVPGFPPPWSPAAWSPNEFEMNFNLHLSR